MKDTNDDGLILFLILDECNFLQVFPCPHRLPAPAPLH